MKGECAVLNQQKKTTSRSRFKTLFLTTGAFIVKQHPLPQVRNIGRCSFGGNI
jgi:hypothetical protein